MRRQTQPRRASATGLLLKLSLQAVLAVLLFAGATALAHPVHISLAEVELNPVTGHLEVGLRVWPPDLERALEHRLGRDVDLDHDQEIESEISRYLETVFQLRAESGEAATLEWVGLELNLRDAWLYFELVPPKGGTHGATLSNRVFFEIESEQTNTIQLRLPAAAGEAQLPITYRLTLTEPTAQLP